MREIKYIVIHCTATSQTTTIESIQRYWRQNLGWKNAGYHLIIKPDGKIVELAKVEQVCNGVAGYNAHSYHISYIGGQFGDDRTEAQKMALKWLILGLKDKYPNAEILGHRDFPNVKKACPRFDVKKLVKDLELS
jgi:N-acetylmuramoyl-L-alanine amidase